MVDIAEEIGQTEIDEEEIEWDQYLVFTIKSQEFGLQAIQVQEIGPVLNTTEVPNSPRYIEGVVNLRGRLASVVNFRKKFGFEQKENDEDTRIVIVEQEGFPIGILVDSVEEVMKIPEEKVQRMPESSTTTESQDFITGVGILDDRLIILLDTEKVLAKTELIDANLFHDALEEAKTIKMLEEEESENAEPSQSEDAERSKENEGDSHGEDTDS